MANEILMPNIVGSFLQGQQFAQARQDAAQQNQLRALQLQQAQGQIARDEQFRNELGAYLQGGANNLAALYAADPERAMQVQQFQAQRSALEREQAIETAKQNYASAQYVINSAAPKVLAETQFPQVVEQAKANGFDWDNASDEDVRNLAQRFAARYGADAGVLPQTPTGEAFTLSPGEVRFDKSGKPIASVAAKPTEKEDKTFENATTLRKEYDAQSKDFQTATQGYQSVLSASRDPSAAGDLALIFAYMKTLDPGSTVREGEFATAQNAGGIPDRVISQYNKVLNGERLAPDQRADFVKKAGQLYQGQKELDDKRRERYTKIAERNGLDAADVLGDRVTVEVPPTALAVGQSTQFMGGTMKKKK